MKSGKMKKIFISILAASAMFAGCNTSLIEDTEGGYGELSLDLSASDEFELVSKASETGEKLRNEDVNEFTVKMVRTPDGMTKEYARFGDMPQMVQLPSGKWTLNVSSPETLPAAFDQPIYGVTHEFDVKVGEVSSEKLVCTLQNIKVSFDLAEEFTAELKDFTITVSNGEGADKALYWTNVESEIEDQFTTKDMSKPGYFTVAPRIVIRVDAKRRLDESEAYHEISLTDAEARDHVVVKLGAKVTGQSGFKLTIDTSVNERDEEADIPGFDEDPVEDEWDTPVGGGDTGSGDGNTGSGDDNTGSGDDNTGSGDGTENPIKLDWPSNPTLAKTDITNNMQVVMYVQAPAGIEEFVVTVRSESQGFLSTCSKMTSNSQAAGNIESVIIDLINDSVAVTKMAGIGLKTGTDIYHKTEPVEFNISKLVPLIPTQGPVYGSDYLFNLSVTDVNGVSNEWDLVFHLPAKN